MCCFEVIIEIGADDELSFTQSFKYESGEELMNKCLTKAFERFVRETDEGKVKLKSRLHTGYYKFVTFLSNGEIIYEWEFCSK